MGPMQLPLQTIRSNPEVPDVVGQHVPGGEEVLHLNSAAGTAPCCLPSARIGLTGAAQGMLALENCGLRGPKGRRGTDLSEMKVKLGQTLNTESPRDPAAPPLGCAQKDRKQESACWCSQRHSAQSRRVGVTRVSVNRGTEGRTVSPTQRSVTRCCGGDEACRREAE